MAGRYRDEPLLGQRGIFWLIFLVISGLFAVGTYGIVAWIRAITTLPVSQPVSQVYANYTSEPADYLKPESLAALQAYVAAHPQPQSVQILKGMSTAQIAQYMTQHVSGGLKVDCSYCHNLANGNFAERQNLPQSEQQQAARMDIASQHMLLAADMNQQWIKPLVNQVGGRQVTCATCHNGQAVFSTYPADQRPLPQDYTLQQALENLSVLQVTGENSPDENAVQYNQNTMYHMNISLGVGCAFCHNARNFADDKLPAKAYSMLMLQMSQALHQQRKVTMNNQEPSCWMCHRGAVIPPGSALTPGQVPAVLSSYPPQQ